MPLNVSISCMPNSNAIRNGKITRQKTRLPFNGHQLLESYYPFETLAHISHIGKISSSTFRIVFAAIENPTVQLVFYMIFFSVDSKCNWILMKIYFSLLCRRLQTLPDVCIAAE